AVAVIVAEVSVVTLKYGGGLRMHFMLRFGRTNQRINTQAVGKFMLQTQRNLMELCAPVLPEMFIAYINTGEVCIQECIARLIVVVIIDRGFDTAGGAGTCQRNRREGGFGLYPTHLPMTRNQEFFGQ